MSNKCIMFRYLNIGRMCKMKINVVLDVWWIKIEFEIDLKSKLYSLYF